MRLPRHPLRTPSAGVIARTLTGFAVLLTGCTEGGPTVPDPATDGSASDVASGSVALVAAATTFVPTAGSAGLLINPIGLDFGPVAVGVTSAQQVVDITNVGSVPVVMNGAGGAPGGDFNAVQNCQGNTLNPGESCQMFFTYTPASVGPATATSSGTWNGQAYSIDLQGAGVGPSLLVSPKGLSFGDVLVGLTSPQQTVDITNVGSSPVVMNGAGGAPGGDFNAVQNCQGNTLNPGESCQMFFTYTPTSVGPATATSSGTWNGQPFSIDLQGAGVGPSFLITPTDLDFGEVVTGVTSAQQIATITNVSLGPVVMNGAGGAPGGDFNAVQNCQGNTLNPGDSCQMFFTYTPTAVGPAMATSSGSWNGQPFSIDLKGTGLPVGGAPASQFLVTPAGLDFGDVAIGTTSTQQIVDITNIGASPVVMSGAGGAPGGDFTAVQNCQGNTLNPGESCQMFFTYTPSTVGPATAVSSGTWNGQPFSIDLMGVGVGPSFLITPSALDFGDVALGVTSAQQIVDITNAGSSPVVMSGAGGAPGGDFNAVQNCQGNTLNPGESCQMFFTYSPSTAGPAMATSSGTWNGQAFSIDLHGNGVGPSLLVTPNGFDFGAVVVGTTSPQQVTNITNVGSSPVTMSGAGGAPGGDFNAVQNCQGNTLNPGESCQMFFTFAPSANGPAMATSSGTWNGQPFNIGLYGTGVTPIIEVDIDVKPGSDPNTINVRKQGVIPVAILGSDMFNVADVDVTTLAFGPSGAPPVHDLTDAAVYATHVTDVNGDGYPDLVSHHDAMLTGLGSADTEACIDGAVLDGTALNGCDGVRVIAPGR